MKGFPGFKELRYSYFLISLSSFYLDIVIHFHHAFIFKGEKGTTGATGRAGLKGQQVGCCGIPCSIIQSRKLSNLCPPPSRFSHVSVESQ